MVSPLQLAPTSAKSWIRHWKQNDGVSIFPLTYHRYITTKRREFREWSTLISNTDPIEVSVSVITKTFAVIEPRCTELQVHRSIH